MSVSDSAIIKDKPIKGFYKDTSLFGVHAPWLKTKGALGKARGETNDGIKNANCDGERQSP